jgi:Icc protein
LVMEKLPAYQDAFSGLIRAGNWQIIMLDSSVAGQVHGHLNERDLQHLESALLEARNDPAIAHTLICLHHNPVPATPRWMDEIGLHNQAQFLTLVDRFDTVRGIVYGHIHQEVDLLRKGVRYFCTPSTCIQFKPEAVDFTLDELSPGYRWFDLHSDGRISSGVERVTGYVFDVDYESTGY